MARRLGAEKNKLSLLDNLSGSELDLFYRMPTTEELAGYSNGQVQRKGNKIKRQLGEMRLKYGALILDGVGDKSFEKQEGGKWVPVISDQAAKGYDKDWKKTVCDQAPDIIEALAIQVFEVSVQVKVEEDEEDAPKN